MVSRGVLLQALVTAVATRACAAVAAHAEKCRAAGSACDLCHDDCDYFSDGDAACHAQCDDDAACLYAGSCNGGGGGGGGAGGGDTSDSRDGQHAHAAPLHRRRRSAPASLPLAPHDGGPPDTAADTPRQRPRRCNVIEGKGGWPLNDQAWREGNPDAPNNRIDRLKRCDRCYKRRLKRAAPFSGAATKGTAVAGLGTAVAGLGTPNGGHSGGQGQGQDKSQDQDQDQDQDHGHGQDAPSPLKRRPRRSVGYNLEAESISGIWTTPNGRERRACDKHCWGDCGCLRGRGGPTCPKCPEGQYHDDDYLTMNCKPCTKTGAWVQRAPPSSPARPPTPRRRARAACATELRGRCTMRT